MGDRLPPGWHPGPQGSANFVREPRTATTVEGCWEVERETMSKATFTRDELDAMKGEDGGISLSNLRDAAIRREERIAVLRELASEIDRDPHEEGPSELADAVRDGDPWGRLASILLGRADSLEKEPPP